MKKLLEKDFTNIKTLLTTDLPIKEIATITNYSPSLISTVGKHDSYQAYRDYKAEMYRKSDEKKIKQENKLDKTNEVQELKSSLYKVVQPNISQLEVLQSIDRSLQELVKAWNSTPEKKKSIFKK